ncbi:MAG: hypothetical protein PHZ00_06485 [Candidatus Peribacteraceae bacterium]|nr:hypothetical protein [Candidatus Peribacteraceae bacterium]
MIIRFLPSFNRAYRKLTKQQRDGIDTALELFVQFPFDPRLHNHKLRGDKSGVRSIAAGFDLRILYIEEGTTIALLLTAGTHDEVY